MISDIYVSFIAKMIISYYKLVHSAGWGTLMRCRCGKWIDVLLCFLGYQWVYCTIDEFIKGAASLRRYGITFDDNIDIECTCWCSFSSVKRTYLEKIKININLARSFKFLDKIVRPSWYFYFIYVKAILPRFYMMEYLTLEFFNQSYEKIGAYSFRK